MNGKRNARFFLVTPVVAAAQMLVASGAAQAQTAPAVQATLPTVTVPSDWLGAPTEAAARKRTARRADAGHLHPEPRSLDATSDGTNTVAENATGSVGRIPSYWLWNAHVGYAFGWKGTRMKAGVGIDDLFDRDHYFRGVDYGQGRMSQPGRALQVSLQVDL